MLIKLVIFYHIVESIIFDIVVVYFGRRHRKNDVKTDFIKTVSIDILAQTNAKAQKIAAEMVVSFHFIEQCF